MTFSNSVYTKCLTKSLMTEVILVLIFNYIPGLMTSKCQRGEEAKDFPH